MTFYSQFKEGKAEAEKEVTQHGNNLRIDRFISWTTIPPFSMSFFQNVLVPGAW